MRHIKENYFIKLLSLKLEINTEILHANFSLKLKGAFVFAHIYVFEMCSYYIMFYVIFPELRLFM